MVIPVIPGARFSEWSQAAWEIQRAFLMGEESGGKWDLHFLSVYHDSDGHLMDQARDLITGRVLSQWWDRAEESGPAARASEPISLPQPTLECLTVNDGAIKPLPLHVKSSIMKFHAVFEQFFIFRYTLYRFVTWLVGITPHAGKTVSR